MGDFRDATQEQIDEMNAQLQAVWDANYTPGHGVNTNALMVSVSFRALDDLIRGWDLRKMLDEHDARYATRNELSRAVVEQAKEYALGLTALHNDSCKGCKLIRAVRALQAEEARLQTL